MSASDGSLNTALGLESLATSLHSSSPSSDADEVRLDDAADVPLSSRLSRKMGTDWSCHLHRAPSIKRLVNSETGEGQTIVTDEKGRTSTFSQETVSSVMKGLFRSARILPHNPGLAWTSMKEQRITRDEKGCIKAIDGESIREFFDEALMRRWVASLPQCHLKGFDQELRIHLSSMWTEYSKMKAEHEDYLENTDYIFFGLDKASTLKDLEQAYRKLARRMHPDKNGGSDEAKSKFQDLKERYEKLKQKMECRTGNRVVEQEEQKEVLDVGQDCGEDMVGEEEEIEDQDEIDDSGKDNMEEGLDRDAMERKIWEILDIAKTMQQQMSVWRDRLEKFV